jgi:hypothetical protein
MYKTRAVGRASRKRSLALAEAHANAGALGTLIQGSCTIGAVRQSAAMKGAVVGIASAVPMLLVVELGLVNPAGQGFRMTPLGLLTGILAFSAAAGALAGYVAGRRRDGRLRALALLTTGSYLVAQTGYTFLVVVTGTSGPSSLLAFAILWLAIAMVTAPCVLPAVLVGAWVLERWTRLREP